MPLTTEHSAPCHTADSGSLRDERGLSLFMCYILLGIWTLLWLSMIFELKEKQQYFTYSYMKGFSQSTQYPWLQEDTCLEQNTVQRISQSHQASALKQLTPNVSTGRRLEQGGQRKDARLVLEQRWFRLIARPDPYEQSVEFWQSSLLLSARLHKFLFSVLCLEIPLISTCRRATIRIWRDPENFV